jgi:hypothetical protein
MFATLESACSNLLHLHLYAWNKLKTTEEIFMKFDTEHLNAICDHIFDFLCGLVVRVPGYRSRGLGSIPDTTRFSEN